MMIIFFYWTINDDHNVPMITMFQGFTVLSANMKELTWYSIDEDNVPIMMIMTHLKWFTVLSANMKQLSEVSGEGNRVVDWFWEGVDLFPGCSQLLIIMFNRHFNDYLTSNSGSSRSWLCWVTAFLYFFRSWGIICNACVIHIALCMYYVFANHCAVVILDAISCFVDFMKLDDDDGTCGNAANQETFASKRRCSSATWSQKVTKTWINMSTASTIPTHQNCKKWTTFTITSIIKTTIPIPIKLWQNLTFATSSVSLGVSLVAALNVFPEK